VDLAHRDDPEGGLQNVIWTPATANFGSPVFFLSYARRHPRLIEPPRELNNEALQLYVELSKHVYELLGLPAGCDAGYLDSEMDGGQKWSLELAHAISHCQVFVPLISPHYLTSEWCAREWHAFNRRRVRPRPGATPSPGDTPTIPVRWSYVENDQLPPEIQKVQLFTPARLPQRDIAALYRSEGLYGLLNLGEVGKQAYEAVVWRLAQRIALAFGTHDVEPGETDDFENLRGWFGEDEA
jgi:hypothetical protein